MERPDLSRNLRARPVVVHGHAGVLYTLLANSVAEGLELSEPELDGHALLCAKKAGATDLEAATTKQMLDAMKAADKRAVVRGFATPAM